MVTPNKRLMAGLLLWYVVISLWTAYEPADRQFWMLSSILPGLLVLVLVGTHRYLPLSPASYVLITMFLSLHTIGVRYTYARSLQERGWSMRCRSGEISMIASSTFVSAFF